MIAFSCLALSKSSKKALLASILILSFLLRIFSAIYLFSSASLNLLGLLIPLQLYFLMEPAQNPNPVQEIPPIQVTVPEEEKEKSPPILQEVIPAQDLYDHLRDRPLEPGEDMLCLHHR